MKSKKLSWKKFVEEFRTEYKKMTGNDFPTLKSMIDTRHPDLLGLSELHEEGWSPKKTVQSYLEAFTN